MSTQARRLIKPTTPRTVHLLNMRGMLPAPVQGEASTESAFARLAALCPSTAGLASQPETLELPDFKYTPDYSLLTLDSVSSFVEIKLEANIEKYRVKFDVVAQALRNRNQYFFVMTERQLYQDKRNEIVRRIRRYAKTDFPDEEKLRVVEYLRNHPASTAIDELMKFLGVSRELIFHLVTKRIACLPSSVGADFGKYVIHRDYWGDKNVLHAASWLGISPWRANP